MTKKSRFTPDGLPLYKIGWVTPDEMEYLQCGLHAFLRNNMANAQRVHKMVIDGEEHEMRPGEDPSLDELWATQNVDCQKLLDKLIQISGGHDLAVEGQ